MNRVPDYSELTEYVERYEKFRETLIQRFAQDRNFQIVALEELQRVGWEGR